MDVRLLDAEPTSTERDAIDAFLGPPISTWAGVDRVENGHSAHGGHAARAERQRLLPTLHALHEHAGWVSPGALNYIAQRLTIPPADVYGVATFYALFSVERRAPRVLHVCDDVVCRCAGSDSLIATLEEQVGPEGAEVDGACWLRGPCLGQCDRAPAALVVQAGSEPLEREVTVADDEILLAALRGTTPEEGVSAVPPQAGRAELRLLRRVGVVDPESLDDYRAHDGYDALRRAFDLGPDGVLREVVDSKLLGRGGAAFPMGRKWEAVARQPRRPHYLICNADESEPGYVQGPGHHRGRPVLAHRGDDDRRLRDRVRAWLHLPPRRVSARPRAARERDCTGAGARVSRSEHSRTQLQVRDRAA